MEELVLLSVNELDIFLLFVASNAKGSDSVGVDEIPESRRRAGVCCPTLRITQIGRVLCDVVQYSTAKQHEGPHVPYNINFLFLWCMHFVTHFGQSQGLLL